MKDADLDDPSSPLSKLLKFVVKKPNGKNSDYVSLVNTGSVPELGIAIKSDSIFVPGDNPDKTQNGFRRTDVLPAVDPKTAFTDVTTFYQSIRFDSDAQINNVHGYLLSSIEISSGDHLFDIFTGSDFDSNNVDHKPSENSKTIRVRDLTTKTLYHVDLDFKTTYNFAVTVDWKKNTLTVYASTNTEALKLVAGPVPNDPKAMLDLTSAASAEFHLQLIKFPLPNPADPVEKRSDVPHFGLQEKIKDKEQIFFSNVFVTSGKEVVTQVGSGVGGGTHQKGSTSTCKPRSAGKSHGKTGGVQPTTVETNDNSGTQTGSEPKQTPAPTKTDESRETSDPKQTPKPKKTPEPKNKRQR